MHFYDSHLGYGIYTTEEEQDYDDLYCDECGDSDSYLGEYDSWEGFIAELDPDMYPYWSGESLAEQAGITLERVYELNPKIKENDKELFGCDIT